MEMKQESEWAEAQKIEISVDLVAAAKQQLKFLAAVDRNRWLYEGPTLERAIFRYKACWLPLLAKYGEAEIVEGPLVVPLDCEWIWHCHRLNPVRYKTDCEEIYGRILENHNVVSSVQGSSTRETELIWNKLYPSEPYDFDCNRAFSANVSAAEKYTQYDLVSAVERQIPFCYQVSRPHMDKDLFLEAAVARYKGFLHIIKRSRENSLGLFCVPTYDIDLIWHSHQLQAGSYCKDLQKLIGKVLEHDDTDSDRSKGKKLDVGFSGTTKKWEDTFGLRYWRAGAMNRGSAPSPVTVKPFDSKSVTKKVVASDEHQNVVALPEVKVVEVMLEFVGVRNLPQGHKGSLSVVFSKTQPDSIFNTKRGLTITSETGEKQVASFNCQPTGQLVFELVSHSPSSFKIPRPTKTLGSASISLEDYLGVSNLSIEKWLELEPSSSVVSSEPISLRVGLSFTVPTPAPHVLHMVRSRPFSKGSCLFPLPGRVQFTKSWTRVMDVDGNEVISLQMREASKGKGKTNGILRKEVIGVAKSGETRTLAELTGTEWSLTDSRWSIQVQERSNKDGHFFEITGPRMIKLYPGRKLDYETKHCKHHRSDDDFATLVEFSAEDPYGKAVALLDSKSGYFTVKEEWLVLPGITLAFILSDMLRKEGHNILTKDAESVIEMDGKELDKNDAKVNNETTLNVGTAVIPEVNKDDSGIVLADGEETAIKSGGCGSGCGGGCGNMVKSGGCGGCGSGCGGGCGNVVQSGGCGGCGSGCGGGCGNVVKSGGCGGCGSGCGGGCGNVVKSGGCGGCGSGCGGGCGNMVKSSRCGGLCGGCGHGHAAVDASESGGNGGGGRALGDGTAAAAAVTV